MRAVVAIFSGAGGAIPIFLMFFYPRALPPCTEYLWPSYILLGATIGREWSFSSELIVAVSIILNMAVYAAVGLVAFGVIKFLRHAFWSH
ncbi:MAG TPA: hypothetical protein VGQ95_01805 [Chthoniobacterales bacterium]|nr:hypothetical protein [Chthoniobacterales bacterium]